MRHELLDGCKSKMSTITTPYTCMQISYASFASQLLDLLLDINESKRIPPFLRYDLRSPTPNLSDVPTLETDTGPYDRQDIEGARGALREAKGEYESGQISLIDYKATEASLTAIITAPQRPQTLTNLCRVTHTKLASVPPAGMPTDLVEGEPTGYLSPGHEDEYLAKLDAFIASTPLEAQTTLPRDPPPTEKEKEKEAQLHNPVSVYNWLRNHSDTKPLPHESEKEPSNTSETTHTRAKPSPKPPSFAGNGSTKPSRKSAASIPKPEPEEELLDEEGFVIGGASEPAGPKGKRKRDDDNAYRPKGGSSKSKKKAKGSGGAAVKKVEPEVEEDEEA